LNDNSRLYALLLVAATPGAAPARYFRLKNDTFG
jgi:hypothetical protein